MLNFIKYIFTFLLLIFSVTYLCNAQKYILLDRSISQPAFFSNKITVADKYKRFFPVEKKDILKFVEALEEISKNVMAKKTTENAKQYAIGCIKFSGRIVQMGAGQRLDYILTSTCDEIEIRMHLCDAKLSNENNAYFIKTWIRYINKAMAFETAKQKHGK
jgi:hypothetical protein